ncbi:hypothetical protein [Streptomyces sp. SID13031]|uniref:hypothetical protein n=1 Tax=Streptomyces sp. SID13031 TaxID=2706046 RepID=UPI0013C78297|nr:hypothetical protein [Streptomyces sp. SID13031]NEA36561.1 hypothetical protein [Streptomyces sp. SID13031]
MSGAERISQWLVQLQATGSATWAARSAIAVAGLVALVLPGLQPWDQMDAIPVAGSFLLVACVLLPDSLAALMFLIVVCGGWLMRAPSDLTYAVVLTGIALLVVHLASAFAGQIPSYAVVGRQAMRKWLLPATLAALLAPVVAVAAGLVRGADVPGSLFVTVAALAAATAAVWFASGQPIGGNSAQAGE